MRCAYNYVVSNDYDELKKVKSSDLRDLMELTHLIGAGREFQREMVLGRKE